MKYGHSLKMYLKLNLSEQAEHEFCCKKIDFVSTAIPFYKFPVVKHKFL